MTTPPSCSQPPPAKRPRPDDPPSARSSAIQARNLDTEDKNNYGTLSQAESSPDVNSIDNINAAHLESNHSPTDKTDAVADDNASDIDVDSNDSVDSADARDALFAFQSALEADVAAGTSLSDAVRSFFGSLDDTVPTANRRRLRALNLAEPIVSALASEPALNKDIHTVAEMCRTIYELMEPTIRALRSSRRRLKLNLTDLSDVVQLISDAERIVVLAGAGMSVSCGIPDFRSTGGLYEVVSDQYNLPDPQAIFDLVEFRSDPSLFYSFAKHIMPAPHVHPSPTHCFVAELAKRGKLLRVYSQNIDGLERRAGVPDEKLVLCHGSFLSGTCMSQTCRANFPAEVFVEDVMSGTVPRCSRCEERAMKKQKKGGWRRDGGMDDDESDDDDDDEAKGVVKPDIVFFGEKLPQRVEDSLEDDVYKADLVLVLGTSLKVDPVARIPRFFRDEVPRVLVNRELVGYDFDVELMGDCDAVIHHLQKQLKWDEEGEHDVKTDGGKANVGSKMGNENVEKRLDGNVKDGKVNINDGDMVEELERMEFIKPRRFLFKGANASLQEVSDEESEDEGQVDRGRTGGQAGVSVEQGCDRENRNGAGDRDSDNDGGD